MIQTCGHKSSRQAWLRHDSHTSRHDSDMIQAGRRDSACFTQAGMIQIGSHDSGILQTSRQA